MDESRLKSQIIPGSRQKQAEVGRYYRRTLLNAIGLDEREFKKPLVAVVNGWNEISPGNFHLRAVAEAVKQGVLEAGGHPAEFGALGLCDGLSVGSLADRYSLPYRDATALYLESMLEANMFDAAVFIPSCDKVVPAFLMAAAKVDIPSIFVTGGYMAPGCFQDKPVVMSDIVEAFGALESGQLSRPDFESMLNSACPGPGICPLMATGNTVATLAEALGLSLPYNTTTPAMSSALLKTGRAAGRQIIKLLEKDIRPSKILTQGAIENAMRVILAVGGSTNLLLHVGAVAFLAGHPVRLERWEELSQDTPLLTKIKPSVPDKTMVDLDRAGGIPAVMKSLAAKLDTGVMTVTGENLAQNLARVERIDPQQIRPLDNPLAPEGGLAVLKGNLAPEGAIVKQSAVPENMRVFEGPAQVFDSEEEAIEGLMEGRIQDGQVVIIRYEGPRGGPGMRQLQFFMNILCGMERQTKVALVTDGRFSGTNWGLFVGHLCPEAVDGGNIALTRDGDRIRIDLPQREVNLLVDQEELTRRKSQWTPPPPKASGGLLRLYAQTTTSASVNGATIFPEA